MPTAYESAINEVVVPVLNRDLCNEWLDSLNVTEGMICAGYEVSLKKNSPNIPAINKARFVVALISCED